MRIGLGFSWTLTRWEIGIGAAGNTLGIATQWCLFYLDRYSRHPESVSVKRIGLSLVVTFWPWHSHIAFLPLRWRLSVKSRHGLILSVGPFVFQARRTGYVVSANDASRIST
jgi:hypothetical protein